MATEYIQVTRADAGGPSGANPAPQTGTDNVGLYMFQADAGYTAPGAGTFDHTQNLIVGDPRNFAIPTPVVAGAISPFTVHQNVAMTPIDVHAAFATVPPGGTIDYYMDGGPAGIVIDQSTGIISGTWAGGLTGISTATVYAVDPSSGLDFIGAILAGAFASIDVAITKAA